MRIAKLIKKRPGMAIEDIGLRWNRLGLICDELGYNVVYKKIFGSRRFVKI